MWPYAVDAKTGVVAMTPDKLRLRARDGRWPIAAWVILFFPLEVVGLLRVVILATSLAAAIGLTVYLRRRHKREGRNGTPGWTIVAAVAAIFIWGGIARIIETSHHQGPGVVTYGDGERSPERQELVEESTYKRHNYTMGAFMLGLGAFTIYLLRIYWNADKAPKERS
jgi:hypothetical protein